MGARADGSRDSARSERVASRRSDAVRVERARGGRSSARARDGDRTHIHGARVDDTTMVLNDDDE